MKNKNTNAIGKPEIGTSFPFVPGVIITKPLSHTTHLDKLVIRVFLVLRLSENGIGSGKFLFDEVDADNTYVIVCVVYVIEKHFA